MSRITDLHNEILNFLLDWSEEARKYNGLYNAFYLRNAKDPKFKKGYWFPGDEEKLYITFWKGGDVISNTPNIYLELNLNNGIRAGFTASDSNAKFDFLSEIIEYLNFKASENSGLYYLNPSTPYVEHSFTYEKKIANDVKDFKAPLYSYLRNEKPWIDQFIEERDKNIYFEEFVQPVTFIDIIEFEESLAMVHDQKRTLAYVGGRDIRIDINKQALSGNSLPMALKGISIENFQGMERTTVNDLPADAQWIFVTGENGYGKTSLLQAIALGLNDNPELEKYIDKNTKINCEIIYRGEEVNSIKLSKHQILAKNDKNYYGKFMVGYGPLRLNIQAESSENLENKSRNNVSGLFDSSMLLKNINYELFSSSNVSDFEFKNLRNAIAEVTNGRIADIMVKGRQVLYAEKLSNGDLLPPLPLEKLASGFRSIINLVGDIIVRFSRIQAEKSYVDFMGIVLIDELENHLHPLLQRELPLTLSKVFPKIQFIASTHSPIPLLGAPKNAVILTVGRSRKEGSVIERLDDKIDFPSLLPNSILTSPVFGFQKIIPESHDGSSFIRTEHTYNEVKENDQRRSEIDTFLTDERKDTLLKMLRK